MTLPIPSLREARPLQARLRGPSLVMCGCAQPIMTIKDDGPGFGYRHWLGVKKRLAIKPHGK